jgi:iron complex outermembrane receptor protein
MQAKKRVSAVRRQSRIQCGRRIAAALAIAGLPVAPAFSQSVEQLRDLSIDQLANIEISSVSKSAEPLSDAPAAIFVISHDDIARSGATTLPEMLRMAPNLEVAQLSPTSYAISARGFNVGLNASLSNKLLVLVDGRSVYTPLFGGVYWDMQGVLPEDIERIEVISGPGATLWGANAVNGVINIITRKSSDTQGGVLEVGGGNVARTASLQYGGRIGQDLTYRIHAEGSDYSAFQTSGGHDAHDGWSKPSGGFRLDWSPPGDTVSLQRDIFHASEDPNNSIGGRDLVATWQHQLDGGSSLQLLAYYDKESRFTDDGGGGFEIDSYDIELQHSFTLGGWNSIVWGVGDRAFSYEIENTALKLLPATRTLNLANVFAQDTISVTDRLKLTLGLKIEDEPYTGVEPMPSARLSWKVTDLVLLWGAASRAVRSATPIDRDLHEFLGSIDYLDGSRHFQPEILTSYELGTRVQASSRASFSISTFYNIYDDLRTIGLTNTSPLGLPLFFNNQAGALVYGVEVWGNYSVTDWWRLSAGFNIQHEHIHFIGNGGLAGLGFIANDPNHQASLRSSIDFGGGVTWDAAFRYVGALHHPAVADYGELDMRLGWKVTPTVEVSVAGSNLLHDHHTEFLEDNESDQIPRSFFIDTRWRF